MLRINDRPKLCWEVRDFLRCLELGVWVLTFLTEVWVRCAVLSWHCKWLICGHGLWSVTIGVWSVTANVWCVDGPYVSYIQLTNCIYAQRVICYMCACVPFSFLTGLLTNCIYAQRVICYMCACVPFSFLTGFARTTDFWNSSTSNIAGVSPFVGSCIVF
jgi:hypothetical protein